MIFSTQIQPGVGKFSNNAKGKIGTKQSIQISWMELILTCF